MSHLEKKNAGMESKSCGPELTFEPCIFGKAKVWLPVDLIEDPSIFKAVISQETWDSSLTQEDRERLMKLMPEFPEDDEKEKQETLRCLFERENFKFGNPLSVFEERLRAGYMNPEIAEVERGLQRATYRDYKFSEQRRLHRLLKEVLISRQELLEAAIFTSPSATIPVKRRLYRNDRAVDGVVDKKYRKILASSKEGDTTPDSSDEGETKPEVNGFHKSPVSLANLDQLLEPKWTDFWPKDLDQQQEEVRTHSTFDPKPVHSEGSVTIGKTGTPNKTSSPIRVSKQQYIKLLENYQDRTEDEHLRKHPELHTKHITLTGIIARAFPVPPPPQLPLPEGLLVKTEDLEMKTGKKRKDREKDRKKRKKKKLGMMMSPTIPPKSTTPVSTGSIEAHSPIDIMSTPESRPSTREDFSTSPATCSPASAGSSATVSSTNDFLTSPASSPACPSSPSSDIKPPLRVHPSFFSLIRDIFSAAPGHSLTLAKLRESLANWQLSPVSMLSTWAILQPSWAKVVDGAMRFLNGEVTVDPEVIPRVRYDDDRQMWQWRSELPPDSEEELVTLFKQWLDTLPGMRPVPPKPAEVTTTPDIPAANVPVPVSQASDKKKEIKQSFAEQERERYNQPHKAFVYKMPDYEAIVAPVKGVFGKETTPNKAREHALLISDRPSYVTILSLVRDAVARLPNGEGTRAAVCELLKDSQYLADSSDAQVNNVVSGALDRLHYEKDPCIKYDVNRKLWIYLHKDRTKEEFERLHMEQAAEAKARKSIARQTKLLPKMASGLRDSPINFQASRPGSAMSDTSSENLSIEVCSPKASPGRAASPKVNRKSPAFAKVIPLPGYPGGVEGARPGVVGAMPGAVGAVSTSSGKVVQRQHPQGQSPFVISPQKIDSLQTALRGLHQAPEGTGVANAGGDNLIRAQLLAAKASEGTFDITGSRMLTMQDGTTVTSVAGMLKAATASADGTISRTIGTYGNQDVPKLVKSMSVPCTLPDGKVVMISPELLMQGGQKTTKKRARSGSGGRKKATAAQVSEANVALSASSELSKLVSSNAATPSSVSQSTSKAGRKTPSVTPSPTSVTLGTNKLATVSEALALKRAEAALQSGKNQGRGQSTITLPHGALKGQTVKSILASVGIPLSGASGTVSKVDTPGSSTSTKQSTSKSKDRKSPAFSGVNILGSQHSAKGRPSSAPSVSGKKSPITSMQHALGHQTIGLTTVTKGGQIVVQPVALGIERPGSAASPGPGRQPSGAATAGITLKAIPVSLAKQHATAQNSKKVQQQLAAEALGAGQEEHDGPPVKGRAGKGRASKQHFIPGNAAAALAHAGKMSGGGDLKDLASVPLSVLFPGARQGTVQKGGMPFLASPFLAGGQIPIASLTDGKGVVFQMPHGSNIMSLPVSGVPAKSGASGENPLGQQSPSSAATTTGPSDGAPALAGMQNPPAGSASKTSSALPSNIVTATIRSALAAAQSRAHPHQGLASGHLSQIASQSSSGRSIPSPAMHPQMASSSGGVPPPYHFAAAGQRPRAMPSPSESKTSLTASSIASIIANLKQNPMAAISLPSVSSLSPSASLSRSMPQPSGPNQPVNPQGLIRSQLKNSAAPRATTRPTLQSNIPRGSAPTLAKSLSQPSVLFPRTPSPGFARDIAGNLRMPHPSAVSSAALPAAHRGPNILGRPPRPRAPNLGVATARASVGVHSVGQPTAPTATLKAVPMQPTLEIPSDIKTVTHAKQQVTPGAVSTAESKIIKAPNVNAPAGNQATGNTSASTARNPVTVGTARTAQVISDASTGKLGTHPSNKLDTVSRTATLTTNISAVKTATPTSGNPVTAAGTATLTINTSTGKPGAPAEINPVANAATTAASEGNTATSTSNKPVTITSARTAIVTSAGKTGTLTESKPIATISAKTAAVTKQVSAGNSRALPGSRTPPAAVSAGSTPTTVSGTTPGAATQVTTAPPQRVIPPFEPRVTRGQTKGKAAKKEES